MRSRTRRAAALALVLVACSPLLGGCSVNIGSSDDENVVADSAIEEGALRLDLTDGLTRAEVGMPEGRSSYSIGNTGGRPTIAVTLVLGDEVAIERNTDDVMFKPADLTDPAAAPTIVELGQRRLDLDATRAVLDLSVTELGLDADDVERWAEEAATAPDDPYRTRVFPGSDIGTTRIEVEVARFEVQRYGIRTIVTLGGAGG